MKCENCGKNPATVHYTAYVNNQAREMHVCHACAAEKGIVVVLGDKEKFSIEAPFLSALGDMGVVSPGVSQIQCPGCGLMYSGFRETGRLGCARCYDAFEAQLKPLLRRIHGSLTHSGKSPRVEGERMERRSRLQQMQEEMELAIVRENFERAAELRDRIRAIREETGVEERQEGGS